MYEYVEAYKLLQVYKLNFVILNIKMKCFLFKVLVTNVIKCYHFNYEICISAFP